MTENQATVQSLGGTARAEKLSPEERSIIAKRAAEARWSNRHDVSQDGFPQATHDGTLDIAGFQIGCANLPDGTRVLSRAGFARAIGRTGKVKGGMAYAPESQLPIFVAAENLNPFITRELKEESQEVVFRTATGSLSIGYKAELLTSVCRLFLKADAERKLRPNQKHIAERCRILLEGFATVGINALVDEATGFQDIRDRKALQEILKRYIDGKLYEWTKTFPTEFFKEIFRLKKWEWKAGKMPSLVGRYINDLVYSRLAPGVLTELKKRNPTDERGRRKTQHHRFLTRDIGHPELTRRIYELLGMARPFKAGEWENFKALVARTFPKHGETPDLPDFDA